MDKKFTLLGWLGFMMTLMLAVVLASCGTSDESVDISENSDTIQKENNATQGEGNLPVLYEWSVNSVFAENSGTRFGIQTTEDGQGIYYNVSQLDGNYTFYCVDIYTGAVSQIENQGRTDFMIFPIMGETVDHMIASNGFSRESLHKTEYYNDDYSSVEGF